MTDLWLHVNTFFIIVLIFFRYSSYIKKYMAAYFICLRKLLFCGDDSFKIILRFLKFFLPGTAKAVPSKLCTVFLCILLNRLRFSLQNVEFGTKRREIRPLRRSRASSPKGGSQAVKFSTKVLGITRKFPAALLPLPLGEVASRSDDGEGEGAPRRATVSSGNKRGSCRLPLRLLP